MLPLSPAPLRIHEQGVAQVGTYAGVIASPDVERSGGRWRLKRWNYVSLTTDTHFVAVALIDVAYAGSMFAYVVDRRTRAMWQTDSMTLFSIGRRMAESPARGGSLWHRKGQHIQLQAITAGWGVDVDLVLDGKRLKGRATIGFGEPISVVHQLAPNRVAYTLKDAGLPTDVQMTFDGQPLPSKGLGAVDWTRSAALRTTRWKWCSASGRLADGRRLGLNLSDEVYLDSNGHSTENAIWVEGKPVRLGHATFHVPRSPQSETWHITGQGLDLAFTPLGARRHDVNMGVVQTKFVQPFGHLAGHVRLPDGEDIVIPPTFGVVEDHLSVW